MLSHDVDLAEVQTKLTGWLRERMPAAEDPVVSDLERSGSGFANVSIAFNVSRREAGRRGTEGMLFRGAGKSDPVYPDFKLERQFRVMRCLQDTDVPVPRVYWYEHDERLFGFPFYIMSKVDGVVPSEFPPYHSYGLCYEATPKQRARMWWGTVEAMANVHKLDWKRLGLSFLGAPAGRADALQRELDYWRRYLDWARGEEQPVLDAGLDWLRANRYELPRIALCWGDARLPNTMFTPAGDVRAVLDWDMALLGDPEWDLAFMITLDWLLSEGTGVPRLEGFPGPAETIERYETLTGWKVEHFRYNEIFATLRAGVIILRVQKTLQKMGVDLPGNDPMRDNFCTQRLADLLGLPSPGASRLDVAAAEDVSGTVQLHLTGPGGGDWYVTCKRGRASRHAGKVEHPDAILTVSAADWAAIRSGETNSFNAWTGGKLKVAGDNRLYQQLADVITKA